MGLEFLALESQRVRIASRPALFGLMPICFSAYLFTGIAIFCPITIYAFSRKMLFVVFFMRRVTFSLDETDHLALKLLTIHERKTMLAVLQEAIKTHLEIKDAYSLSVTKGERR